MKKLFTKLCLLGIMCLIGGNAWAELTPTDVINEDFNDGTTTLFTGVSRMSVANDNNVKFIAASNSQNSWSNATYNFDTDGASAVKIQFAYWLTNGTYNACFIIRDGSTPATHSGSSKSSGQPGFNGAFFSVGRTRQSSANWFSINHGKTIAASVNNLGLWCQAEVYIDLVTKKVDYTISQLGGDVIKSETGIAFKDANAAKVSQIDFYTYGNNEVDYLDNLVITKYEDNTAHNYTVNAVDANKNILKQLAAGVANEDATYSVSGLSYVISKDGVNYKLADADATGYSKSFTMGTTDETKTVSYASASDITYFFEAESILSKSYGNNNGAYSGGTTAGVNSGANLYMSNIVPGIYTVKVNTSVRRANEDRFKVQTCTDGINWKDEGVITLTSSRGGDYSIESVILPATGSIRLVEAVGQNMCHYVDYVILTKTADLPPTTPATVSTAGMATFCSPYNLDFSETSIKAYKGVVEGEKVTLTKVDKVKAGEGILLYAERGATVDIPVTTEAVAKANDNAFVGTLTDIASLATNGDGVTNYILNNGTSGLGFYLANNKPVGAGKAYLQVPTENGAAQRITISFSDETLIEAIKQAEAANVSEYYSVSGTKMQTPARGINIVKMADGTVKKIMVK